MMDQRTTIIILCLIGFALLSSSSLIAVLLATRDERRLHHKRLNRLNSEVLFRKIHEDHCQRLYLETIELKSLRNEWVGDAERVKRRAEYRDFTDNRTSTDAEVEEKIIASDDKVIETLRAK